MYDIYVVAPHGCTTQMANLGMYRECITLVVLILSEIYIHFSSGHGMPIGSFEFTLSVDVDHIQEKCIVYRMATENSHNPLF